MKSGRCIEMRFKNQRRSLTPHQVMVLGFATMILVGTLLLALPISSASHESIGLVDALFTATSAVCVTGLIVVETGADFTVFGQTVMLLLVQIGGLGFMTFGVIFALVLGKRITLRNRLVLQEWNRSFSIQGMVRLTLSIVVIALILEFVAAALLTFRWSEELGWGRAMYHGIFHAVMGFNSAGFALQPVSLSAYVGDPYVNIIITMLLIIGGIGFTVLLDIYDKRKWRTLSLHSKLVLCTSALLMLSGFGVIFIMELFNPATFGSLSWSDRLWASWFQAVTPRSGGFNTIETGAMTSTSLLFTIFLMFVGAGTGSTGGGIKVNTFAVLVMTLMNVIKGNRDVTAFRRRISSDIVHQAIAVVMLSLGLILLVTLLLTISEHARAFPFLALLFEVTSAFGTVGLSMGITSELSELGKLIVTLTMFIGRLGPLTFAFAMTLRSAQNNIRYPEDKVLIG